MGAPEYLRIVLEAIERGMRPKVALTVSEWADAHRRLSIVGSAEPGQWKTARTPYLREIMDQLSEHSPARKVVFMKCSQIGGTEVGANWLGYIITHAKGPVAVVMPSEKSMVDWITQKFDPMSQSTPQVAEALARRSNTGADNSVQRKRFTGGILYAKTAGSTSELKSTSLRYAIADEVDEYDWATIQGDPLGLLEVRLTTYADRKLYVTSSPTLKDASRIEELFEAGDKRRFHVPCPHCGEYQPFMWGNLRWKQRPGARRVEDAWYVCRECGAEIDEQSKPVMLERGRWIAEAPEAPYPSYHINALYAPVGLGLSWRELAEEWIEAQDEPGKLMRFVNTRLGETWADRSRDVRPNTLAARAEPYALRTIPAGCLVLTAGCDVQDDRIEVQILGFGAHGHIWTIDYHVLQGSPADEKLWARLAEYLDAEFINGHGRRLRIEAVGIDSGGHHTHAVYAFCRSGRARRAMAMKGASNPGRPILGRPSHQDVTWRGRTDKKGVLLYTVGADTAKHHLYAMIDADGAKDPSERRLHFSQELEPWFYDQLVSEIFNPRKNRWEVKKGKRNEALDTWVYALAASHHPELYLHKWRQADWERRRKMLEPDTEEETAAQPSGQPQPSMHRRPRYYVHRG